MIAFIPLAWLQLSKERFRFATAVAGVVFAVILILVQLGFQDALFESAVTYHGAFDHAGIEPHDEDRAGAPFSASR